MPKLRNGHVPVADLSSYQHSEPRHKLPRAFTTELSDIRKESVVLFFFFLTLSRLSFNSALDSLKPSK